MRVLRLVVEELLRGKLYGFEDMDDFFFKIESRLSRNDTTNLWVQCLIKLIVFIIMILGRAEKEGDWSLLLLAVNEMMSYFRAAGHMTYARHGLYFLRSIEPLPKEVLKKFLKDEHVMRRQAGLWNGMWSDMFMETTFMRYGHGPGGLIEITLNESAMKRWELPSQHST